MIITRAKVGVALLSVLLAPCIYADQESRTTETIGNKTVETLEPLKIEDILYAHEQLENITEEILQKIKNSADSIESTEEMLPSHEIPIEAGDSEINDSIEDTNEKSEIGEYLFQGDIILTPEQSKIIVEDIKKGLDESLGRRENSRRTRQALKDRNYPRNLWMQGAYFSFYQGASELLKNIFRKAAKAWEKDTCINITEDSFAPNRIHIVRGHACSSHMGKTGGPQILTVATHCERFRSAAHELGHALGMFHSQSRHDRDDHLTIHYENMLPRFFNQFERQTEHTNNNYGIGYDYGSIMHYHARSFTYNGLPTMVPKEDNYLKTLGSDMISFADLAVMNKNYRCDEQCKGPDVAKCENKGFPHPRNCSMCICPGGYGGQLCNERPPGCGREIEASSTWDALNDVITSGDPSSVDGFAKCTYWIRSPDNTQIEIRIANVASAFPITDNYCSSAGVEIKINKDHTLTGPRFCFYDDVEKTVKSTSNFVPIITFNRNNYWSVVDLYYRYVDKVSS